MLSIIIPIYNVEKYIARCVHSLMAQTLQDIEYIFVNDASTDKSLQILESIIAEYPERQTKIISHPKNKGLAAARNTGLDFARGSYIMHCDSDDWIDSDMCKVMYSYALSHASDIVITDVFKETENKTSIIKQEVAFDKENALRQLLRGELKGYNCNKIIKKELYTNNELKYLDGINMWEDLIMMIQLFYYAKTIHYIPKAFYHYVQYNSNSYTNRITSTALLNMIDGVTYIEKFFNNCGELTKYYKDLSFIKLTVKQNLLMNTMGMQQRQWNVIYPESNPYIFSYKVMSLFWRIALYFAAHKMLFLYNLMREIYKIIK